MKFMYTVNCCNFKIFHNNVVEIATPNIRTSQNLIQKNEIFYTIKTQFALFANRIICVI